MCARTQTHGHTASLFLFLSLSLAHKTHQQLGGGPRPLPYYHSNGISRILAQMKTLWAASEIFILPVNGSILIITLHARETLSPELMSCNWRCLVHQTGILSFCELQDLYSANFTCVFMWQMGFHSCCEDFQISVNLHYFLRSTEGLSAKKNGSHLREAVLSRKVMAVYSN